MDGKMIINSILGLLGLLISVRALAADPATIKIDGSSTVFPITEAVSEEFQTQEKGQVRITVGISGTGGGFKKFCRGETDVQNASRPISTEEAEVCKKAGVKYLQLPVGYDAIVIAVHPSNTLKNITLAELKKIWEPAAQGKVSTWNAVNQAWPKNPLKLYGAGADSGTFDYFTEVVVRKAKSSRGDYTASEDDNTLVQGISSDKGALGFIPHAYFEENKGKLKELSVEGVFATKTTVENGTYKPLSRPIFIYVSEKSLKRPEVRKFAEFYLDQAPTLVPEVKYVALPAKDYTLGKEKLKQVK